MGKLKYWPFMDEIKGQLSKVSKMDFRAIVEAFGTHAAMEARLKLFNAQLVASAKRADEPQNSFVDPSLMSRERIRECFQVVGKLIQEESERRSAEEEELSRRITPEDVRLLEGFGLTLTHLILSGRPLTPREQALFLRLVHRTGIHSASGVWEK